MSDNTIHLSGNFRHEEALASGSIKPGHLLELTSATADTVKVHATEGGYAERAFAIEDALQGNTKDTTYATTTRVMYNLELPGNEVQAWLAAGENVAKGARLISAGDGTLIAEASATSAGVVKQIIAIAAEALDLSDSGDVDTLIDVRVM